VYRTTEFTSQNDRGYIVQWIIPRKFIHGSKCGRLIKKLERSN